MEAVKPFAFLSFLKNRPLHRHCSEGVMKGEDVVQALRGYPGMGGQP